ncbi:hypothetical protein ACJDU8_12540 [Clostridium sp. WILCCON 0269]|uniref:Uncharacterized protein n=1 Tax=Candidatus Clostridium eludens TaxID=3381663 RepID=A0ABW8SKT2_9CLOT
MNCCIFNEKKLCNNCNECYKCDLNPNKKCNNCGECLEVEGYDTKAIQIDTIIEDEDDLKDYERENPEVILSDDDTHMKNDENNSEQPEQEVCIEFIDDVDGLREILEDKNKFEKMACEEYPGLIRIIKSRQ